MKLVEQSWKWIQKPNNPLQLIELAGRTCYKSEDKITEDSAEKFVKMICKNQHESVLEHSVASVGFITNRGVTHELVRHRLCSFSQESTRYVKYDGDMEFIKPVWWDEWSDEEQNLWLSGCNYSERLYQEMLRLGSAPQQARDVLPNSLKTEIVVTTNLREWRHIFKLRCNKAAHPQIRELMLSCLNGFKREVPIIFEGL